MSRYIVLLAGLLVVFLACGCTGEKRETGPSGPKEPRKLSKPKGT